MVTGKAVQVAVSTVKTVVELSVKSTNNMRKEEGPR